MGKGLEGKRIMLAASRKTEEMTALVEKQGGTAVLRPLQGTVFLAEQEVEPDVRRLLTEGADWVILTTGIGTEALANIAERMGKREEFLAFLAQTQVASRGYKTLSVLKKWGITPAAIDEDGTTAGLMRALEPFAFSGQRVAVQLHGDPAPKLIAFLQERGALVSQILPYRHVPPQEEVVEQACREILAGEVDAVCFTAAIQVRFLFEYVKRKGILPELLQAFQERVLAVAVGKVCAEALQEEGVERVLAPEHERMGAMIIELAQFYGNASSMM